MRRPRAEPLATATTTSNGGSSTSSSVSAQTTAAAAGARVVHHYHHHHHNRGPAEESSSTRTTTATPAPPATATRYHINHFDSGGMPVSLWGMDRRDVWRTCFCFHVRTVTIFIGVWYLMMYILALSFHAALLMYEPNQDGVGVGGSGYPMNGMAVRPDTMLPTPVSKIGPEPKPVEIPRPESLTIDQMDHPRSRVDTMRNGPLTLVLDTSRKATSQVILLTVCNMLITLLMVYGAVRGKPSYLMPFFVLRVFDFCIFCLTMVGYFSYLPNVTDGIMNTQGMPFKDDFLRMDPQLLSFITLVFIVAFIAVKAYIIGVIWNCYKYLMLRNTVIRGVIAYRHDDPTSIMGLQQNLLPDLPDYETAVNDPRYAKKPPAETGPHSAGGHHVIPGNQGVVPHFGQNTAVAATTIAMPPPPPYSVAVASEPLHLVLPNMPLTDATTTVPLQRGNDDDVIVAAVKPEENLQASSSVQSASPVFVPVQPKSSSPPPMDGVPPQPPQESTSPSAHLHHHHHHLN